MEKLGGKILATCTSLATMQSRRTYSCTRVSLFGDMFQHLLQTLELGLVFLYDGRENILLKKIFTAYSVFKIYIWNPQRNTNKRDPTLGLLVDVPLLPLFVAESSTRWSKKSFEKTRL